MSERIAQTIEYLAGTLGCRPAGSASHRQAAAWLRGRLEDLGLEVRSLSFTCPDFTCRGARLEAGAVALPVRANRHTPSCCLRAPLVAAQSIDEVSRSAVAGSVLLLHGELAAPTHFPRNFTFFRVEAHDALLAAVEEAAPGAVLFGTDEEAPHCRMEDSQFPVPNATLPAPTTARLLATGGPVTLELETESRPAEGCTLVGRTPGEGPRIVLAAHYDTNHGTPGALDNAAGIAAMLDAARLILERQPAVALECVAFGGEDSWYPGDALYFEDTDRFKRDTRLFVNLDGPGCRGCGHAVSLATFNLSDALERALTDAMAGHPLITRTDPWMQSDHAFAVVLGVPTIAFSSPNLPLVAGLVHTSRDTPAMVDAEAIADATDMLAGVLTRWP